MYNSFIFILFLGAVRGRGRGGRGTRGGRGGRGRGRGRR